MTGSSVMTLKKASHYYTFEVNYAKLKALHIKKRITSPAFDFDGYKWVIHYFQKHKSKDNQFISLELLDKADDVTVHFSFLLQNKNETKSKNLGDWSYTFYETDNTCGQDVLKSTVEEFANDDGNFYILCKIRVASGPRKEAPIASGGLLEDIRNLFDSTESFDVTFEVEGDQIPAHKVIMAARSPVFKAELFGYMEEADMKVIKIRDMKANVFKAMLSFMYTDEIFGGGCTDFSIEFFLDLFEAADIYAVEKLKGICIEKLTNNLTVDNVATVLVFADRHSCAVLKETCLKFASEPENFMQLALTEGYIAMIEAVPSLLVELRQMVSCSGTSKKQRIS